MIPMQIRNVLPRHYIPGYTGYCKGEKVKKTVFIDGQHGTTGLKIRDRLSKREDIEVIEISEAKRKEPEARKTLLNEADIVFL
jgi:hypothetical protein